MHYKIKGLEIHTENTAKSFKETSAYLSNWLLQRDLTPSALDFGCGKLRYTKQLAQKSSQLGVADSHIQLTRIQNIYGESTTVIEFIKREWPTCFIHTLHDFKSIQNSCYHFALCSNVLSAIPSLEIRSQSIQLLYSMLKENGLALIVNQHSNSYFKNIFTQPTTRPHLDGWITISKNGSSYYGVLPKEHVIDLMRRNGFQIEKAWVVGQSNYVLTRKVKK